MYAALPGSSCGRGGTCTAGWTEARGLRGLAGQCCTTPINPQSLHVRPHSRKRPRTRARPPAASWAAAAAAAAGWRARPRRQQRARAAPRWAGSGTAGAAGAPGASGPCCPCWGEPPAPSGSGARRPPPARGAPARVRKWVGGDGGNPGLPVTRAASEFCRVLSSVVPAGESSRCNMPTAPFFLLAGYAFLVALASTPGSTPRGAFGAHTPSHSPGPRLCWGMRAAVASQPKGWTGASGGRLRCVRGCKWSCCLPKQEWLSRQCQRQMGTSANQERNALNEPAARHWCLPAPPTHR